LDHAYADGCHCPLGQASNGPFLDAYPIALTIELERLWGIPTR